MTRLIGGLVLLAIACAGHAQPVIATYSFAGEAGGQSSTSASFVDADLHASVLMRGPGIVGNPGSNSINSNNWTTGTTIDPLDYYTFTLTPIGGLEMDLAQLLFTEDRSATGPVSFELRSSLDAFASTIASGATSLDGGSHSIDLGASFQDLLGPAEFRLYAFGATGATGTWRLSDSLQVTGFVGDVAAIPEPRTYAMLLAGLGLLAFSLRRAARQGRARPASSRP